MKTKLPIRWPMLFAFLCWIIPSVPSLADPIDDVIAQLSQRWQVKIKGPEITNALKTVKGQEDQLIERLMSEFNKSTQSFAYRHRAVHMMEIIASETAQASLQDIALGEIDVKVPPSMHQWASRAFVTTMKDKTRAKILLDSPIDGVVNNALIALKGSTIAPAFLKQLQQFATSEEPGVRRSAITVLFEAPNPEYTNEKVDAILAGLEIAKKYPRANQTAWPGHYTHFEASHWFTVQSLAKIKGAGPALRTRTTDTSGTTRSCILLARAELKDDAVLDDIRKMARDSEAGIMRQWAVRAIGMLGNPDENALLNEIAANDPLSRKCGGCLAPRNEEICYPVRSAAQRAIREISKRHE